LRQGLHGALGLHLLNEREQSIQRDHEQHGDRYRLAANGEGQRRGKPKQQRERVRQLASQLTGPLQAPAAVQFVGAVLNQPTAASA
jgi:hypothetical protein